MYFTQLCRQLNNGPDFVEQLAMKNALNKLWLELILFRRLFLPFTFAEERLDSMDKTLLVVRINSR